MKGVDPQLVKWGIFALVFLVRAVVATNRKRKEKDKALRPPQSTSAPAPISSPTMNQTQPRGGKTPKENSSDLGSPWSTTKGPFD